MLMPKEGQIPQAAAGRMKGKAWRGHTVAFGDYGLKAMEPCWLTDRPDRSGACRHHQVHQEERANLDPGLSDKPVTKKPQETRMGKGKGSPEYWVAVVRPGRILYGDGGCARGRSP